jgi:4-hydroxymandelate oxidase
MDAEEHTSDGIAARYLDAVEAGARRVLDPEVHRYYTQGARDGITASEAARAWERFRFVPRVLHDVTEVDLGTELLGTRLATPFAVAPTTLQRAADAEGEVAMARGVAAAGALLVVSSNAGTPFADVAATGVDWWLQMYVTADRSATLPVVQRAVDAGARAIVLTVDTPVVGTKYDVGTSVWESVDPGWLRVNFTDPRSPGAGEKATDLGPQDIAWLAQRFDVPVVVKGVLHSADARRCVDAGAAAVWVSNHGGRQLDRAVAAVDVLEEVAAEVADGAEVYVDGGVRRGTDALAAAALGARAVFLGRLPLFGLACDGEPGVRRVLAELGEELEEGLRLAGCTSLAAVPRDLLRDPATSRIQAPRGV